jgi:hypothetical protein
MAWSKMAVGWSELAVGWAESRLDLQLSGGGLSWAGLDEGLAGLWLGSQWPGLGGAQLARAVLAVALSAAHLFWRGLLGSGLGCACGGLGKLGLVWYRVGLAFGWAGRGLATGLRGHGLDWLGPELAICWAGQSLA